MTNRRDFLKMAGLSATLLDDPLATQRLRQFNDAKFGMFIHWGPYSLASVEASWPIMTPGGTKAYPAISEADYRALPQRFNPAQFDPAAWVQLARDAGQRYMVFTAKHHDGFCMFDSAYTRYKISNTPYKQDVCALLAAAAKERNMPLGFYYSPPDMDHRGFRDTSLPAARNMNGEPERAEWALYLDYMEMQLRELMTRYGDVFVVWFDGLANQRKYDGARFHKLIRETQPLALINNRIGLTGDYVTPEQRIPKGVPVKSAQVGATNPNDQGVPPLPPSPADFQPWETCMTINGTWAYNRHDTRYKSATQLIRGLIEVASKGGNLLLNVGPTPEGTIQPEFQERLREMGRWLKTNGAAIYGSSFGPLQDVPFAKLTAKAGAVYLHVFDWPGSTIEIKGLAAKVRRARLLADGSGVRFRQEAGVLRLSVPRQAPDAHASVVALETGRS